ncbi:endonuclease III [Persicimonas caeni]|uniref:Endonuclease III n=1 Tax=Persicimonas caeni TaxID=2292766 RepID=A0A4Y6PY60_PERCE|nr:endonuclease III [Persicimonas caeni]QDG53268.1 endonuclease III [Persicimonas caeni]QED34490.1 endonuclease III [Persicimonas caeni]
MTNEEKAQKIGQILDDLYPEPPIPLDHTDGFTLTIAVLLSAQCTDKRVNMVTPGLFELADNPFDMAELSEEEILGAIKSCGLAPTKAKRIKKLSEMLVEEGGALPSTLTGLQKLPGVGRKTAQVVLAQWFDVPSFPVDTHIHRLAERWGLSSGKNVRQTEKDLRKVFPKETWNRRHLQIIYFGREYCPARGHEPEECPICKWAAE